MVRGWHRDGVRLRGFEDLPTPFLPNSRGLGLNAQNSIPMDWRRFRKTAHVDRAGLDADLCVPKNTRTISKVTAVHVVSISCHS